MGAEVVQSDLDEKSTLRKPFDGARAVFSVQNGLVSGFMREVAQGRNVADVAKEVGVQHLVFASAGTGEKGDGPEGDPLKCKMARLHGIMVDSDGSVFIGDSETHRVRVLRKK